MFQVAFICLLSLLTAAQQQHPRDQEIKDADTRAWWHLTEDLAGDDREGRDTGSAAYDRAANDVAGELKSHELKPGGENGTYFQLVPMREVAVTKDGTTFTLTRNDGRQRPLRFLQDITIAAAEGLPPMIEGPLAFRGYCSSPEMTGVKDKIAVCFNSTHNGMTTAAQRLKAARIAGAIALVLVDDPYFLIEPPRWPVAYARSVRLADSGPPGGTLPTMRLSANALSTLLEGTDRSADELLALGGKMQPLPSFEIETELGVTLHTTSRDYSSRNVLAILPERIRNLGLNLLRSPLTWMATVMEKPLMGTSYTTALWTMRRTSRC